MKSMRLSDLKKYSNKFFKEYGIFRPNNNTTDAEILYFVRRSYEALPKKLKMYLDDDKERTILTTAHIIRAEGEDGRMDAYNAFLERAHNEYKSSGDMTKELLWREFKLQTPYVYNHYNTYVYRLGKSASRWFMQNAETTQLDQYNTVVVVPLPIKTKGVSYSYLSFIYHWDRYGSGSIKDVSISNKIVDME